MTRIKMGRRMLEILEDLDEHGFIARVPPYRITVKGERYIRRRHARD